MPRTYSLDLRDRVVELVASGEPSRAVAELIDCKRCERHGRSGRGRRVVRLPGQ